jgi:hypothetical protein
MTAPAVERYPYRIEPERLVRARTLPVTHLRARVYRVASHSGGEPHDVDLSAESPAQPCDCGDFTFRGALFDCHHVLASRLAEGQPEVVFASAILEAHQIAAARQRERRERRRKTA